MSVLVHDHNCYADDRETYISVMCILLDFISSVMACNEVKHIKFVSGSVAIHVLHFYVDLQYVILLGNVSMHLQQV